MKKTFCFLFPVFLFLFLKPCLSQVLIAGSGSVSFFSKAPLENIDATNKNIQSIFNTSVKSIAFIIPIRGFKFRKDLMEEHFNEKYMESDKYPNATYSGKINEEINLTKDTVLKITSSGKLSIHGAEKEVTQPGTLTVKNGEISLESTFPLAIKDFNIEIPKLLFQNIADTVTVKLNVIYKPYKK